MTQAVNPRDEEHHCHQPQATWWRMHSPGTYYWRCLIPARHLPGQVLKFKASDITGDEHATVFPRQRGAAVWQFAGNATQGIVMRVLQTEHGVRTLMEVDDNYLTAPDTGSRDWQIGLDRTPRDKHSYEAHRKLTEFCDGVIVSVPKLADAYKDVNPNIYLCPNSVDPADWPQPVKPDDGVLRIGWAASPSHIVDAPLVMRALRWAARQPNVQVLVYGIGDFMRFPRGVKNVGWTDTLTAFRESLAPLDVAVCPLYSTPWADCKSDIKAMEAAMAGALPIVSDGPTFAAWRDRTISCRRDWDWDKAIRWCVRNRDEVKRVAAEAKAYVLAERTIEQSVGLWREAICG